MARPGRGRVPGADGGGRARRIAVSAIADPHSVVARRSLGMELTDQTADSLSAVVAVWLSLIIVDVEWSAGNAMVANQGMVMRSRSVHERVRRTVDSMYWSFADLFILMGGVELLSLRQKGIKAPRHRGTEASYRKTKMISMRHENTCKIPE